MLEVPSPRPLLRVERVRHREGSLVIAHGELDYSTADLLDSELRLAAPLGDLVVDLDEVSFLGAAGIRVLLHHAEEARDEGRSFTIGALRPQHRRLLARLGILDELPTT